MTPDLDIGDLIGGTYRLERVLGHGAMGKVYLASHVWLDRRFAIKVVTAAGLSADEARERFHREARITSGLHHPNIVEVTDYNLTEDGVPYLVMELLEGESLSNRIKSNGRLDLGEAVRLFQQIASALALAHAKEIIHRDLKPQNIFVCRVAGREVVKVLDFGISKMLSAKRELTQTRMVMGSIPYIAPEQLRAERVDQRADIHSLGAMLYEMLSGRRPFSADSTGALFEKVLYMKPAPLRQLVPELPEAVERVVQRAMEKKPDQRWPDVSQFWDALALASGLSPFIQTKLNIVVAPPEQGVAYPPANDALALTIPSSPMAKVPSLAETKGERLGVDARDLAETKTERPKEESGPAAKTSEGTEKAHGPLRELSEGTETAHGPPCERSEETNDETATADGLVGIKTSVYGGLELESPIAGLVASETAVDALIELEPDVDESGLAPLPPADTPLNAPPGPHPYDLGPVAEVGPSGRRRRLIIAMLVILTLMGGLLIMALFRGESHVEEAPVGAPSRAGDSSTPIDASNSHGEPLAARSPAVDAGVHQTASADIASSADASTGDLTTIPRSSDPKRARSARGTLQISVFSGEEMLPSKIYLDGKLLGMTPLYLPNIKKGTYTLEAHAPGYKSLKRTIEIKPRRSNRFVFRIEKN